MFIFSIEDRPRRDGFKQQGEIGVISESHFIVKRARTSKTILDPAFLWLLVDLKSLIFLRQFRHKFISY